MKDLKISLVQAELHWEDIDRNLSHFDELLSKIESSSTDIIVLPEMFTTGFTMNAESMAEGMEGKGLEWLKKNARAKNCVITGSLVISDSGKFYNRLIWMMPDGSYKKYDKRHLFRMAEEHHTYSAGTEKLIVEYNGWRICPLVCYDLRFPVWSRNESNYDCLIYVANWPEKRSYPWKQLLIARAIENQAYVIGLNRVGKDGKEIPYSGDSLAINPRGEIMSGIKPNEESIETVTCSYSELQEFRKQFPAYMDADKFTIL